MTRLIAIYSTLNVYRNSSFLQNSRQNQRPCRTFIVREPTKTRNMLRSLSDKRQKLRDWENNRRGFESPSTTRYRLSQRWRRGRRTVSIAQFQSHCSINPRKPFLLAIVKRTTTAVFFTRRFIKFSSPYLRLSVARGPHQHPGLPVTTRLMSAPPVPGQLPRSPHR